MHTADAIERLKMKARKVIKNRGHFHNDEAAKKQFAILFAERFTAHL
nr:hypothetical protein [Janthinobacterium lividum]